MTIRRCATLYPDDHTGTIGEILGTARSTAANHPRPLRTNVFANVRVCMSYAVFSLKSIGHRTHCEGHQTGFCLEFPGLLPGTTAPLRCVEAQMETLSDRCGEKSREERSTQSCGEMPNEGGERTNEGASIHPRLNPKLRESFKG